MLVRTDLFAELDGFDPRDLPRCRGPRPVLAGPARRRARPRRARRARHAPRSGHRPPARRPARRVRARRAHACACCSRRTRCTSCCGWCRSGSWWGSSKRSATCSSDVPVGPGPPIGSWFSNLLHVRRLRASRTPRAGPAHRARLRAARAAGVEHRAARRVRRPPPPHRHPAPHPGRRVAQRGRLRVRRHPHPGRDRVPRLPRAWWWSAPDHSITHGDPGHRDVRALARRRRRVRQLRVGVALHRARFGVAGTGGARRHRRRSARCSSAPPGSRRPSPWSSRCPLGAFGAYRLGRRAIGLPRSRARRRARVRDQPRRPQRDRAGTTRAADAVRVAPVPAPARRAAR